MPQPTIPAFITLTTTGVEIDPNLSDERLSELLTAIERQFGEPVTGSLFEQVTYRLYESFLEEEGPNRRAVQDAIREVADDGYRAGRFVYNWTATGELLLGEVAYQTGHTWRDPQARALSEADLRRLERAALIDSGLPLPTAPALLAHAAPVLLATRALRPPGNGPQQVIKLPASSALNLIPPAPTRLKLPWNQHQLWLEIQAHPHVVKEFQKLDPHLLGYQGFYSEFHPADDQLRSLVTSLGTTMPLGTVVVLLQTLFVERADRQRSIQARPFGAVLGQVLSFWDHHGSQTGQAVQMLDRSYQRASDVQRSKTLHNLLLNDNAALHLHLLDQLSRHDSLDFLATHRLPDGIPVCVVSDPEEPPPSFTHETLAQIEARLNKQLNAIKQAYRPTWKRMPAAYQRRKEKGRGFLCEQELRALLPVAHSSEAARRLERGLPALMTLGTWRMTRGIYRIDETLLLIAA